MSDQQDQLLAEFVHKHPRLFVLTGAGCSTASGLGDYRDTNGEWKRKQPITGQIFINDEFARKRYWARSSVGWPSFDRATPNKAHHALRSLEKNQQLSLLVTQNVDRLHQKAGHQNVIDLHGILATVSCLECGRKEDRNDYQQRLLLSNQWLSKLTAEHAPDGDADLELEHLEAMNIPNCVSCKGLLKPDVVFFGENVAKATVEKSIDALRNSDALLVVGSSLMVYSGFRFCRDAQKRNQPIVIVNNGKTRADDLANLKIQGDCGQLLQALVYT
ncbi:NAD-dependent protein deacetylase [Granulosicoccus sp.]|nr:NAD-dependent protein deacetylase [Granulosicoccus sp.]MDB4222492.1 NAD-dependent protein deacetylase [Granulosicoccus sp.]